MLCPSCLTLSILMCACCVRLGHAGCTLKASAAAGLAPLMPAAASPLPRYVNKHYWQPLRCLRVHAVVRAVLCYLEVSCQQHKVSLVLLCQLLHQLLL